jgi:preprotein translocase subunit SecB
MLRKRRSASKGEPARARSHGPDEGEARIIRVYFLKQQHELVPDEGELPEEGTFSVKWEWLFNKPGEFRVLLGLRLAAAKQRPEITLAEAAADFQLRKSVPREHFLQFVQRAAPSILFPYLREAIASLTGRGPYGAFQFPPLLVGNVVGAMKTEEATGFHQLEEDESLLVPSEATASQAAVYAAL